jgi:hypothetical protein
MENFNEILISKTEHKQLPHLEYIFEKVTKMQKYVAFITMLNSLSVNESKAETQITYNENAKIEQIVVDELKDIEHELEALCIPQINQNGQSLIINIAQVHSGDIKSPEENRKEIEYVANIQKKIEKIILKLIDFSKKNNLSISFFDEGNGSDSSLEKNIIDVVPIIVDRFLEGNVSALQSYIEHIDILKLKNDIPFHFCDTLKYGLWTNIERYLKNQTKLKNTETEKELLKMAEDNLSKIDINIIYYNGIIEKLICWCLLV